MSQSVEKQKKSYFKQETLFLNFLRIVSLEHIHHVAGFIQYQQLAVKFSFFGRTKKICFTLMTAVDRNRYLKVVKYNSM